MKHAAAAFTLLLSCLATGCGGGGAVAEPVATSSCASMLYEGEGDPDVVVVADFPRRGVGAQSTRLMIDAIEHVFRQRGFRAGSHRVGYQACNDTIGNEPYDEALCRRNAQTYVSAKDVVGIIGPWNSGCAEEQIPIVSRRDAGPLAMISPSNTSLELTRPAGRALSRLYPDAVRSYARVVTHDEAQGIAAAQLAARLKARRVAVVHQSFRDSYVRGLTLPFVREARRLGLETPQLQWPRRESYAELAAAVGRARPDVVYLVGLTQLNAKTLVEDLRSRLGPRIPLIAPDSFAASDVAQELGDAGEGMLVTAPGFPPAKLPPAGRRLLRALGEESFGSEDFYVVEAAQSAQVLLDAIGRSNGTRASVVDELFATKVENGLLGSFSFDRFGDIDPAPVGVYRFRNRQIVVQAIVRAPLEVIGG